MTLIERLARKSMDTLDSVKSNIDAKRVGLKSSRKSKSSSKSEEKYDLEVDVCCNGHTFKFLNSHKDV